MKVILQKDVPNLGDAGEIKDVAAGFARNFLIPRKLVVAASTGSARAAEHQKKLMELSIEKRNQEMQSVAENLKALGELEMPVRVGSRGKLFGSVTTMAISQALHAAGFPVDKRKVELSENIKSTGKYQVKIRLAEKIIVPLSINVVADEESIAARKQEEEEEAARNARAAAARRVMNGEPAEEPVEETPEAEAGESSVEEASAEASAETSETAGE